MNSLFRHNAHGRNHTSANSLVGIEPSRHEKECFANSHACGMKRAMTVSHSKTGHVAEMTKRCSSSQPDVVFIVMNALVNVLVDEVLLPVRMVTAMNPTIAIQNAHAFELSSILARQKMKMSRSLVVAMTKMMVAIRQNSIHHLRFAEFSASWRRQSCPFWLSISRMTLSFCS